MSTVVVDIIIEVGFTLVGILIALAIQRETRARLVIDRVEPRLFEDGELPDEGAATVLRVKVTNKAEPCWFAWFQDRLPALGCRATIMFYDTGFQRIFDCDMNARWTKKLPPKLVKVWTPRGGQEIPVAAEQVVDVAPTEDAQIDVLYRAKGSEQCYGLAGDLRPGAGRWCLEKGTYYMKVQVKTGGRLFARALEVENSGPFECFDLRTLDKKKGKRLGVT